MNLTPLELSVAPKRFIIGESHYDFETQKRSGLDTTMATTFRATQTHGTTGKPMDNDND